MGSHFSVFVSDSSKLTGAIEMIALHPAASQPNPPHTHSDAARNVALMVGSDYKLISTWRMASFCESAKIDQNVRSMPTG